ncbi:hypothetical protein D3C73_512570 [compost metagenome]
MGKRNWQGIIWSAVTILILISFMTPFIIFTLSFLMVPVLILYVKHSTKQFIMYYLISLFVVFLLSAWQGSFLIALSLFFLPPVLAMGNLYKRKTVPARAVITAGAVALLAESLLSLILAYLLGFDPIGKFKQFMGESLASLPAEFKTLMPTDTDLSISIMVEIIPLYLIGFVLFYAFVTHGVSRWLLNKSGEAIPGLPPLREWKLPKSFVWIYLVAFVIDLFIKPDLDSLISTLLLNLLPVMVLLFSIQALSFLFFVAHSKNWNRAMPITAAIILVVFSPLMFLYSLLGVFDVAYPIRERFKKNN